MSDKSKEKAAKKREAKVKTITALANAARSSTAHLADDPKKKGWSWGGLLSGAAKVAADLVPAMLPFLLATHAPTMSAVRSAQSTGAMCTGAMPVGAPLAAGSTLGNMIGVKNYKVVNRDSRGNVNGVVVTTLDFITALPATAFGAGDMMYTAYLSPEDPAFMNTKFSQIGDAYERYRIRRAAVVYEPVCAATNNGAISMCIFKDPTISLPQEGATENIRAVSSQAGGEEFQIWSSGMAMLAGTPLLYTDPDGTDIRLTIGGLLAVVCSADLAGGFCPGNLYLLTEVEYNTPSTAMNTFPGSSMYVNSLTDTNASTYAPILTYDINNYMPQASFSQSASYTDSGTARTGNAILGLSPGAYLGTISAVGTVLTAVGCDLFLTDEAIANGSAENNFNVGSVLDTGATNVTRTRWYDIAAACIGPVLGVSVGNTTVSSIQISLVHVNSYVFASFLPQLAKNALARDALWRRTQQGQDAILKAQIQSVSNRMRVIEDGTLAKSPSIHMPLSSSTSTSYSMNLLKIVKRP